jgi:RNA polymerase-binding transcription factor DksA
MDKISQRGGLLARCAKTRNNIAFTMDDVRRAIQQKTDQDEKITGSSIADLKHEIIASKSVQQSTQKVGAASIADILGFNPHTSKSMETRDRDPAEVPAKYRKYYKLLLGLKAELKHGLSRLTKENLSYGSDDSINADEEPFDSRLALSLISSEQEALTEIELAIERIHSGTYGICEATGRPIEPKRLEAVPFTRFSLEGQQSQEQLKIAKERTVDLLFEGDQSDDVDEFSDYEDEKG